jgi:hypothetical protein
LLGKTYTADFTKYPEDLEVTWVSSDTSIVTVTQTGVITPVSLGAANISIYYYDDYYGEDVEQYVTVLIVDSLGLESGNTYYIMNAGTGRLMASSSTETWEYTRVVTLADNWSQRSQWEIFQSNDGHYTFYGFGGSSGILLEAFGTSVELESQDGDESEKFHIYRIENGIYAGLYYIRQGDYYVAQDSNNNVYLTTVMGTNTRWSFMNVEKGWADFYGFTSSAMNGDSATNSQAGHFESVMAALGYNANSADNAYASTAYNIMRMYDDVFVFRGHGEVGGISFYNSSGSNIGHIATTTLSNSGTYYIIGNLNDNALKDLRCVLYLGCFTGESGTGIPNLVDETFDKGAHFVLGTDFDIDSGDACNFLRSFLSCANLGMNISSSIEMALKAVGNNTKYTETNGTFPIYYVGDVTQNLSMS